MATQSLITVCLLWLSGILAVPALSTTSSAADASVNANVLVTHADWTDCGKNRSLKLLLQVQMENTSKEPFVLGRFNVAQERLYREAEKGNLERIGTTATPDEFTNDLTDPFVNIEETKLSGHASKTFTVIHYYYVSPRHVQSNGDSRRIIASFHITTVRRAGSTSDYWSRPVSITLPLPCELY